MGSIGFSEVLVVLVLVLIVFGPRRLPDIARQVGAALGELRRVSSQFQDEIKHSFGVDENFPYLSGPPSRRAMPPAQTQPNGGTPAPPSEAADTVQNADEPTEPGPPAPDPR